MRKVPVAQLRTLLRQLHVLHEVEAEIDALFGGADFEERDRCFADAPRRVRAVFDEFRFALNETYELWAYLVRGMRSARQRATKRRRSLLVKPLSLNEGATASLRFLVLHMFADLERLIRRLASAWVDGNEIARVRALPLRKRRGMPSIPNDPSEAKRVLVAATQPSHGRRGMATRKLEIVFDQPIPRPLSRSLDALILWRHEFTHRNRQRPNISWDDGLAPDFGTVSETWLLTCVAIGHFLVARFGR